MCDYSRQQGQCNVHHGSRVGQPRTIYRVIVVHTHRAVVHGKSVGNVASEHGGVLRASGQVGVELAPDSRGGSKHTCCGHEGGGGGVRVAARVKGKFSVSKSARVKGKRSGRTQHFHKLALILPNPFLVKVSHDIGIRKQAKVEIVH